MGSLAASGTSDESIGLTAPASVGTYYYGACVDAVTGESDTSNNCSSAVTVTIRAPDLVVESRSVSDNSPIAGASFTLSATVRNQGDGSSAATTLRYYRSTDATISGTDTQVDTDAVSALSASGTSAESIRFDRPLEPRHVLLRRLRGRCHGRGMRRAAAGLLLLAGVLGVPEGARAQTTVWSTTMTIGTWGNAFGNGNATGYGYTRLAGSNAGELGDTDFSFRGTDYTVGRIVIATLGGVPYRAEVSFDPGLEYCDQLRFRIQLATQSYRFTNRGYGYFSTPSAGQLSSFRNAGQVGVSIIHHPTEPDAINTLLAVLNPGQVVLTWVPPCDGSSAITHYEYRQKRGEEPYGEWISIPESAPGGANSTRHVLPSLSNPSEYTFEVRAVNATGEGTATSVQPVEALVLNVDAIAGNDTVNIAEKAAGFTIGGDTGSESGVAVAVRLSTRRRRLPIATSASDGAWSVSVPAAANYIRGTSVAVRVSASKTGFAPSDVTRTLTVDLTAPTAPSYTAPASLKVGVAVTVTPSGGADIAGYSATGLPPGLSIDPATGVISGTPSAANASTQDVTVTVQDSAGNPATAAVTFPATAVFDATAGICGRTEQVRDAIVGLVSGVTHCALVTDAHLAAITGTLDLNTKGITALAAGDFDGLTALTLLYLQNNSLTTLPAGVFDELTALTALTLYDNSLTTLPDDVFDGLTALTILYLHDNSLTTLPDDVFEELTALTFLLLQGNSGAPFSPTAVALPDDGTVLDAGGDVTLDGSGSDGGPWGTNVTYSWAASGATVTFDDAASATPVVTIPALAAGTELTFTLTVTGRATNTSRGTAPDTDTATVMAVFDATAGICGRTEQVRTAIVGLVSGVTHCALVTDAHLADITGPLNLNDKGITALAAGDFDGLTKLTLLGLARNSLTTLPAGVFDELTALTQLYLDDNSLTTLPAGVFDGLSALETLRLDDNQLTSLPAGVFDELTALTGLLLWANSLTTLSAGVFDELTALTDLLLNINDLASLPAGVFDELTSLTRLDLGGNSLSTLPADVFDELTALTGLNLNNNSLTTLPDDVFDGLTALTGLSLFQNSLSTLPAGVFDELTALTELQLHQNSLTTLPAGVFDELTALTYLSLHINPGAPFSPTADALPDDGTVLDAGGDVTLDGSGSGGPWGTNVTYGWALTSPRSGVTVTFDDAASATPVVTIPALADGTELTFTLTVTGRATNASNGTAPDTDNATVTAVFDATAGICGRTEQVRDAIVGLVSGVTHCALVTDAHLADITGTLNLLNKGITKGITALAAGDFDGLTALTALQLAYNSLTTLPANVFDGLTSLTRLDLAFNSLTTLPAGVFDELTALTYLSLEENSLSTLPAGVFDGLSALETLRLSDNPGAYFSPTAVAVPDDGEVSFAGGDVTLDGSGSDGGPWGTNVTYGWALTSPTSGVTVTFDDAASATPVVTIPALADGTELTFTLTVTGRPTGTSRGGTDIATVTAVFDATAGICGRTEQVRTAIVGLVSGVTHCALVTDAHLAAITGTLNLRNKGITALAAGDFDELTALEDLFLDYNPLTTLSAGVFDGLTALTRLFLDHNSLSTLPADVFDELTALTELQLHQNSLTTLPAGVFDELTALTGLRLDHNSLSTLPAGVFDKLTALTGLRLGFNDLASLPAGVFDELTALTGLDLDGNSLSTLPDDVFDKLISLTGLRLQGNSGAPFSPTADALPDDGTVLDAGGDVTLDGSGSDGGPWGTNVTYSWAASGRR